MNFTLEKSIKELGIPIEIINQERRYWLVRTLSGEFYDEFYHDNFIAIGWDEFNEFNMFSNTEKSIVIKAIEKQYPDEKQPGRIYNQICRFLFEIKQGDIVMIPSHNSTHISFGVVLSEPYLAEITEAAIDEGVCPFKKRRNIKWIKTVKRIDLDPYLYKMMQSHHTISNADDYSHFIDRTLSSFFVKGHSAHFVVDVKRKSDTPAIELINLVNSILDLAPEVNHLGLTDQDFTRKDVDLKLNVQSPGIIEFFSNVAPWCIVGIGIISTALVGGTIKVAITKEKSELEHSSDGIIEKLLNWKKQKDEQELKKMELEHRQALEKMNAKLPQELEMIPSPESPED